MAAPSRPTRIKRTDRPLLDTTVDQRYFVEEQVGEVPEGLVFQARHLVLRRPLTLTVLHRKVSEDQALVKDLKAEAADAARILSPHAALIADIGRVPDHRIYFTRVVPPGQTLVQRLASRKLSEQQAVDVLEQLEDVLAEMHGMDLVHRRIQPAAVQLSERRGVDFVKLLDIGCAAVAATCDGPSPYHAPEQRGGELLTPAADIFALGVLAYVMVTGVTPALDEPLGPLREREPWVSEPYAEAVRWALAADPAARPATVSDLVEELANGVRAGAPKQQVVVLPGGTPHPLGRENLGGFPAAELAALLRGDGGALPSPHTQPGRPRLDETPTLRTDGAAGVPANQWVPVPEAAPVEHEPDGASPPTAEPALRIERREEARPAAEEARPAAEEARPVTEEARPAAEASPAPGLTAWPRAADDKKGAGAPLPLAEREAIQAEQQRRFEDAVGQIRLRSVSPEAKRMAVGIAVGLFFAAVVGALLWARSGKAPPADAGGHHIVIVAPPDVGAPPDAGAPSPADAAAVRAPRVRGAMRWLDAGAAQRTVGLPEARGATPAEGSADDVVGAGSPPAKRASRAPVSDREPAAQPPAAAATGAGATDGEGDTAELNELLQAARRAYVGGLHRQALELARKLLGLRPAHVEALQIAAVSACHMGQAAAARDAHARLPPGGRALVEQVCARKNIDVGGPAKGSEP